MNRAQLDNNEYSSVRHQWIYFFVTRLKKGFRFISKKNWSKFIWKTVGNPTLPILNICLELQPTRSITIGDAGIYWNFGTRAANNSRKEFCSLQSWGGGFGLEYYCREVIWMCKQESIPTSLKFVPIFINCVRKLGKVLGLELMSHRFACQV